MADAVIGSLPRGLSLNEREKIFASTPLSPTLSMLSSMPSVSPILLWSILDSFLKQSCTVHAIGRDVIQCNQSMLLSTCATLCYPLLQTV